MNTVAMILVGILVAWQIYALYSIYSKSGTTGMYIGWMAFGATGFVIIWAVVGFN